MLNYKQLHYFWRVAKVGSIARAAEQLRLAPQTISSQIGTLEESRTARRSSTTAKRSQPPLWARHYYRKIALYDGQFAFNIKANFAESPSLMGSFSLR